MWSPSFLCLTPPHPQSFVHDPRSVNQSSVKANIKLRFTNKAGKTMVVIRSMEVTQKKTTMTFKALDGVLRSTSSTGEKVSLSHKCSELDRQIPDLIGVSKVRMFRPIYTYLHARRYAPRPNPRLARRSPSSSTSSSVTRKTPLGLSRRAPSLRSDSMRFSTPPATPRPSTRLGSPRPSTLPSRTGLT